VLKHCFKTNYISFIHENKWLLLPLGLLVSFTPSISSVLKLSHSTSISFLSQNTFSCSITLHQFF
jgi:hypothetical protein